MIVSGCIEFHYVYVYTDTTITFYGARTIVFVQVNKKLCILIFLGLAMRKGIGDVESATICPPGFEPGSFQAILVDRSFCKSVKKEGHCYLSGV